MKLRRSLSIRFSIVFVTALSGVLLAFVLSVLSAVFLSRSVITNKLHASQLNLQLLGSDALGQIKEMETLLEWPEKNPTVVHYLTNLNSYESVLLTSYTLMDNQLRSCTCKDYVIRYLITDGKYRTLELLRNPAESRLVVSANLHELDGISGFRELWWNYIGTDPLTVGEQQVIPLGHAIKTIRDDVPIGYVYLSVSPDFITNTASEYALDSGCRLLWQLGSTYWELSDQSLSPLGRGQFSFSRTRGRLDQYSTAENTQVRRVRLDGADYYYVSVGIEGTEMSLIELVPYFQFSTSVTPILTAVLVSALFMGALALLEHLFLCRTITDPVCKLQRQIERLSSGDFTPDSSLEWDNELGDVGRGINQMAVNISTLMERRLEDEKQKQDLEYQMLQGQINPHFVFNTLYSIKWMATFQNAPGIAEMTTALARLLKSVSKGTEKLVPLYNELALLNDYFVIQQYRYGGNISIEIGRIDDESLCRDCMIPRFTLQPLVENAIFHGIEPNGEAGTVLLDILCEAETGDVLIAIRDNGVGIPPEKLAHLLDPPPDGAKTRSVGLWNVSRRLQYHFGPQYNLKIESEVGHGTTVTIRLPYHSREGKT